jgi:hypothetical protein
MLSTHCELVPMCSSQSCASLIRSADSSLITVSRSDPSNALIVP